VEKRLETVGSKCRLDEESSGEQPKPKKGIKRRQEEDLTLEAPNQQQRPVDKGMRSIEGRGKKNIRKRGNQGERGKHSTAWASRFRRTKILFKKEPREIDREEKKAGTQ